MSNSGHTDSFVRVRTWLLQFRNPHQVLFEEVTKKRVEKSSIWRNLRNTCFTGKTNSPCRLQFGVVESWDSTMVSKRYLDTEYFLMRFNLVTNSHFDTSRTPWRLSGLQPVTVKSLLVWWLNVGLLERGQALLWLQAPERCSSFSASQLMEIFWRRDQRIIDPRGRSTYTSKHELGSLLDLWLYDGMDLDENKFMNRMLWKVWRVQALEFHKTSLYVR